MSGTQPSRSSQTHRGEPTIERVSPPPPNTDPELIAALRADLAAADYTVSTMERVLGANAAAALRRENPAPARIAVRAALSSDARDPAESDPAESDPASSNPAATLIAVLTLGASCTPAELTAALPTLTAQGARNLGIVEADPTDPERLRAAIDLSPYSATDDAGQISWWIASDRSELASGHALPPDHVLGVGGATITLTTITPRHHVQRALDLGCGCGIQALHASRHADHVVATDLSERALAFTAFNAALNGIHVDLRHGSVFEPVEGESFDLIVSNPPFVITPRTDSHPTWTYRDGQRVGDSLMGELLAHLSAHLAPGGFAVMLGNWEITPTGHWSTHPTAWLSPALEHGINAWVIQREREDPAAYAETWARDGGITPRDREWEPLIGAWLEDFASRQVDHIGFGYVLLHRPEQPHPSTDPSDTETYETAPQDATTPAAANPASAAEAPGVIRCEHVTTSGSGTLSTHLRESLRMLGELTTLSEHDFGQLHPRLSPDVREHRYLVPGDPHPEHIQLMQGAGFGRTVEASTMLAGAMAAFADGSLSVEQTVHALCALTDADPAEAAPELHAQLRELLIIGMLQLP